MKYKFKRNVIAIFSIAICSYLIVACGNKLTIDAEGFSKMQDDIILQFGADTYYSSITISDNKDYISILCKMSKDPASLKGEEWLYNFNGWNATAEITHEVSEGALLKDFMFQLKDKCNLKKVGELVEKSIQHLQTEKQIEGVLEYSTLSTLEQAQQPKILIALKPKNGGTTFHYTYDLDGKLLNFDY